MKYFKLLMQKPNQKTAEFVRGYNKDEETLRSFYEGIYPGCEIISVQEDDFNIRHKENKIRQKEIKDKLEKIRANRLYIKDRLIMWKEFLDHQIDTGAECYKVYFNETDREVFLADCEKSVENIIAVKHNVPVDRIEIIDVEHEIIKAEEALNRFKGQISFWEEKYLRRAKNMRACEYEYHKSLCKADIKKAI
ncbi:hypothetical protein [Bacillus bombysepticus]|uniref:hypothetical protein n=1 Tax=Bacillus bombysepticus TaxID=658666 RepID=UPI0030163DE0